MTKAQTFDREAAAKTWIAKKENALAAGAGRLAPWNLMVGQAIKHSIEQSRKEMGKTKALVLGAVKGCRIADFDCLAVIPADRVDFAIDLG